MGNSTTTLQSVIDFAKTFPDLNSILSVGGFEGQPALTIANDVMRKMISPAFPWKWNQFKLPYIYTNSFQQDYAGVNLVNLAWLAHGVSIDINNTALPKPIYTLEVVRDNELTSAQYGTPGQVSWLPNDQLFYGTWAANSTYGKILGVPSLPANPLSQIEDSFGNLWVATNFNNNTVTTGSTSPFLTNLKPVFPTVNQPTLTPTTVTDGTVIWTAVNPKGQGIRINPIPGQTGIVYQFNLIGQMRAPYFTSKTQTIEPIPDNDAEHFRRGFIAYAYMHSKDPDVRAKFQEQYQMWLQSLTDYTREQDREKDNTGLIPTDPLMQNQWIQYVGPANPYFPGQ